MNRLLLFGVLASLVLVFGVASKGDVSGPSIQPLRPQRQGLVPRQRGFRRASGPTLRLSLTCPMRSTPSTPYVESGFDSTVLAQPIFLPKVKTSFVNVRVG